MKLLVVTFLGVSLAVVGCGSDSEAARENKKGSVGSDQSSLKMTSTRALAATPPRPTTWYAGPITVTPAVGSRLAAILHSLRTEPVVAIVAVTDIQSVTRDSSGVQLTIGKATLRVDELWKRADTQPDVIRVGFTYPFAVLEATSNEAGKKRSGNGILLQVGDQIIVSGRHVVDTFFPDTSTPVNDIAPSTPDQQGMLIRGDIAIGISDGLSVPLADLKDAAQGRKPSDDVQRLLFVPSSSTSSVSNLPD